MTPATAAFATPDAASGSSLAREVIHGLMMEPRTLPGGLVRDARRSLAEIDEPDECYLGRAELSIVQRHAAEMADEIGPGALLVELGPGAGERTRLLLAALHSPAGYVPIDGDGEALRRTRTRVRSAFADLPVETVCADFAALDALPRTARQPQRVVVYFPGSAIGDLHAPQARWMLSHLRHWCGRGGGLLAGVDLVKSPTVLVPAYDDHEGIAARIADQVLGLINRDADADFHPEHWEHRALWNPWLLRVETHLVSRVNQTVRVDGRSFAFGAGDRIRTACAYKYTPQSFADLAEGSFTVCRSWLDAQGWFAVMYLRAA